MNKLAGFFLWWTYYQKIIKDKVIKNCKLVESSESSSTIIGWNFLNSDICLGLNCSIDQSNLLRLDTAL